MLSQTKDEVLGHYGLDFDVAPPSLPQAVGGTGKYSDLFLFGPAGAGLNYGDTLDFHIPALVTTVSAEYCEKQLEDWGVVEGGGGKMGTLHQGDRLCFRTSDSRVIVFLTVLAVYQGPASDYNYSEDRIKFNATVWMRTDSSSS